MKKQKSRKGKVRKGMRLLSGLIVGWTNTERKPFGGGNNITNLVRDHRNPVLRLKKRDLVKLFDIANKKDKAFQFRVVITIHANELGYEESAEFDVWCVYEEITELAETLCAELLADLEEVYTFKEFTFFTEIISESPVVKLNG